MATTTLALITLTTLSACVMVPVDPRTGLPYPMHPQQSSVTVLQPPPSAPQMHFGS